VSNDNPFSEEQFRTFKYRPEFPDRFGAIEHARRVRVATLSDGGAHHADHGRRWTGRFSPHIA
jgi:hypothetical protein